MRLILGDCLEELVELDDNSVDSIVTDPPYGLKFMGKKWDYEIPSVDIWKECIRVLKPGGHALIACGTRTQHRMAVNIEDAGFEIRDVITWLYGSGFPKSLNIGKNGGPEGWGTALKPACEFWTLARKPLSEKTVVANVVKWGTGGINIDGCRVEFQSELDRKSAEFGSKGSADGWGMKANAEVLPTNPQGRFPTNLILDEQASLMLDEQSRPCKTGDLNGQPRVENKIYGSAANTLGTPRFYKSDPATGASRFFYCAKASKSERNKGLEGLEGLEVHRYGAGLGGGKHPEAPTFDKNHHPTVKPIKLMEYLCRLITPTNGIILDPFMGSGSTGVAAKNEGFRFNGIERDPEYFEIAKRRIG